MPRLALLAFGCLLLVGCNTLDDASAMEAYVDAGYVMVRVHPGAKLYIETCSNAFVLQKRDGGRWVAPQDDVPFWGESPGYFLDGEFVRPPPPGTFGCDFAECSQASSENQVAPASEYVKNGTRAAPDDDSGATQPIVDEIETRPLEGQLRVLVTYSTDSHCNDSQSATLPLTIPPAS